MCNWETIITYILNLIISVYTISKWQKENIYTISVELYITLFDVCVHFNILLGAYNWIFISVSAIYTSNGKQIWSKSRSSWF